MKRPGRIEALLGARIAPSRFVLFLAVLVVVTAIMAWSGAQSLDSALSASIARFTVRAGQTPWKQLADAVVIGFDAAVVVFALALLPLGKDHSAEDMRCHAAVNDANRGVVLAITALATSVIMFAMLAELPEARKGDLVAKGVLVATLGLSWLFTNLVFMLHYAHMHYTPDGEGVLGGFEFPGTTEPNYWDFLYFSFTAGMSFAASDVNVRRQDVRKVLVFQCLLAFMFNIGALAFCINVLAST